MNLSRLGLVLLNYGSHQKSIECIESILSNRGGDIHIVVVDNRSSDNSYEILKNKFSGYQNIEVLQTDYNGGYSYGNNFGLNFLITKYNEIEYLGIINPDILIIDDKTFYNLIERLSEDNLLAGIAPVMILNNTLKPERLAYKLPKYINSFLGSFVILKSINPLLYRRYKIMEDNLVAYVDVLPGSFFIVKKDIFIRINLFDEKVFLYGEENIIGEKIKREDLKLGLSFRDYYIHKHINSKNSLKNDFLHLWYSIKSHIYFNTRYKNLFWGILDTLLLIIFIPIRIIEVFIIRLHSILRSEN